MARRQQRSEQTGTANRGQRRPRDNDGILPVLAKAVREVETSVQRGRSQPAKFQAIALLVREERARVNSAAARSAQREAQLKRLDGIATILAQTAAREPYLLSLLGEDAEVSDPARRWKRELQVAGGLEPDPEVESPSAAAAAAVRRESSVAPQSVVRAQLANPFLAPDFSGAEQRRPRERRLAGWELIGPLLNSFEHPEPGASSCMELPEPATSVRLPPGLELMPHQARLLAAAAGGHRTFLLADEPGLGKTAQALLAAQAADRVPAAVRGAQRGQDQLGP